jgi:predicted nucleic acid-binding protein
MKVIDTNVISAFMSKDVDEKMLVWLSKQVSLSLFTTAICIAEIEFGLALLPEGVKKRRLLASFSMIETRLFDNKILPFDRKAAQIYSQIASKSIKAVVNCGAIDLQIASIALEHDAVLVSRNIKDFKHIKGLSLENPFK